MQPKIALLITAVLLAAPVAGNATTITYTLTGNLSNLSVFTETESGVSYTGYFLVPLTDATTGLNILGDLTLNVGDTIDGSITLNSQLTIPASGNQSFSVYLLSGPSSGVALYFNESLDFYDKGVAVSTPANWLQPSDAGALILAETEFSSSTDPSLTFDTIDFSETITKILTGGDATPVSSVDLTSQFDPNLSILERTPTSVPEPATPWLLLAGLGAIWMLKRKRTIA